jgi:hypothetical protein
MTALVERVGALSVGRIETVTAAELRIGLFNETPQATALDTGVPTAFPRINAYVLIPNETGAVVASSRRYQSSAPDRLFPAGRTKRLSICRFPRVRSLPSRSVRFCTRGMPMTASPSMHWSAAFRCSLQ